MSRKARELAAQEREERVVAAKKAVETKQLSLRVAEERYSIPKSTIHDHVAGRSSKTGAGRPPVLSLEEEKAIVRSCLELAQSGFGVDRIMVNRVVRDYLQQQGRENPFKDGVPGKKWWVGFLKRWPNLSERKPQHFPTNRAQASTPTVMDTYFKNVEELFAKLKLDKLSPSERGRRIWNCDETGICTAVASHKVLARRGAKNVHETGGGSGRDYITILACGSAIGERLPPYILYKGKNLMAAHTHGGPPGTCYSMSDSGWMEGANFLEWFRKLFLPAVDSMRSTGPVVLFIDGHQSHSTLSLVEEARDKGIVLYVFPPHTTHLLQPMDVGVYGPLKQVWSQVLKEFKLESMAARVDKAVFPSLVARMWDRVLKPEHIIGGFRAAGIHPLSRNAIPLEKLKTSAPFEGATEASATAQPPKQSPHSRSQPPPAVPPTPVSIHIAQFFGNLFAAKGSTITVWIRQQEQLKKQKAAEKAAKKGTRKTGKNGTGKQQPAGGRGKRTAGQRRKGPSEDENMCQTCGGHYDDDDEESQEGWIGCDERGCRRWYHYWCVGHLDMPDPKLRWICPACKEEDA